MSTVSRAAREVRQFTLPPHQSRIRELLKLQKASQKISSILDLELLIDKIVNDVACSFGCVEVDIFLRHETREEMVLAGVHGCKIHSKGNTLKIGEHGIVGHVAATGRLHYAPDVARDPYYLPCDPNTRSEVGIPLIAGGNVIGVFTASHPELDGFPRSQIEILRALTTHVAIAVDNARRFDHERQQNLRFTRDAEEARLLQQSLLPNRSLLLPGFSVAGSYMPAGAVGGDWYDYIELGNGKWGFVLADVSGKGMAAALLMSATRGLLRSLAEGAGGPGDLLARLNRVLLRDFPGGRYVTMIYGVLDPAEGALTFANAGHPWPIVIDDDGVRLIETETGVPLGLTEATYSECTIALTPRSRVFFYSDGIIEANNERQEEYGTTRLIYRASTSRATTEDILLDVKKFANGEPAFDDATVLLIAGRQAPVQ
jgi:phosphoserine phosphatase RsbU/P